MVVGPFGLELDGPRRRRKEKEARENVHARGEGGWFQTFTTSTWDLGFGATEYPAATSTVTNVRQGPL